VTHHARHSLKPTWSRTRGLLAFVVQENDEDRPTLTIHRDALLGLIHRSGTAPSPHTVPREQLRARGSHDDLLQDDDLTPSLSPILVAGVIVLLAIVFLAALHVR
jgi:hypothetical protein